MDVVTNAVVANNRTTSDWPPGNTGIYMNNIHYYVLLFCERIRNYIALLLLY